MSRARRAVLATLTALAVTGPVAAVVTTTTGAQAAPDRGGDPDVTRLLALQAGLQVGPKHATRPQVRIAGRTYAAANPYLSQLRGDSSVDYSYWRRRLTAQGRARAAGAQQGAARSFGGPLLPVPTPYAYTEQEPEGALGQNDSLATSEHLDRFGTDRAQRAVKIAGRLSLPSIATTRITTREDQGSIRRATRTGVGTRRAGVTVSSRIGDGPHGRNGDRHGDFDFFKVHARPGDAIRATTRGSRLDTVLALYGPKGRVLDANDDLGDDSIASALNYPVTKAGDYYVMVAGFSPNGPLPASPFRSGSGSGRGDQGAYRLRLVAGPVDHDYYGVHLRSGDVLGGTLRGHASTVQVHRVDGRRMISSQLDMSSAYPVQSPLPGGGATFAYVAEEPGWYAVSAADGRGTYSMLLEGYRPGSERGATGTVQTLFLDFDGARLNTGIFGGDGVSTLAPLSRYLPRWRLTNADEDAVIDSVVAAVKENIDQTLRERGLNHRLSVRVLNSRDDNDPFGRANVSRVVVGGSIRQSGVPTIGIAQSIDPGNFGHEETALVMLDSVSEPRGPDYSFNSYLSSASDRVGFVGRALGNVVAHETGHMIGSFHTDGLNRTTDLMDSGGANQDRFYGVGPDGLGGTADDQDVDFGVDRYEPEEGLGGWENTLNTSAWAFLPGRP